MIRGRDYAEAARAYIGTPMLHQGWNRAGMDCRGLLLAAAVDCGLMAPADIEAVPALMVYQRIANGVTMSEMLRKYCDYSMAETLAEVRAGDIVCIKFADRPQHLAIITNPTQWGPLIVHAWLEKGVIEHRLDKAWLQSWRGSVHGVFTLKHVNTD